MITLSGVELIRGCYVRFDIRSGHHPNSAPRSRTLELYRRSLTSQGVEFDDPTRGKHDGAVEKPDVSDDILARQFPLPLLQADCNPQTELIWWGVALRCF